MKPCYASENEQSKAWKEHAKMNKVFIDLNTYAKKNPNIIEIAFSEEGIPLHGEQKHSKDALQFSGRLNVLPFRADYSFGFSAACSSRIERGIAE